MKDNFITNFSESKIDFRAIQEGPDEIDLRKLLRQLWEKRKLILLFVCMSLLLGIIIAITTPIMYTADCVIVSQSSERSQGNIGGLASMMGVNLNSNLSGTSLSPSIYPRIVKSVPFCKEIMETNILLDNMHTPIKLHEYYMDKKYRNKNLLLSIKKYTINLPMTIKSLIQTKKNANIEIDNKKNTTQTNQGVIELSPYERSVISIIQNNTLFESNKKDGSITIGYIFPERNASAQIAEQIRLLLEKYVIEYKAQKQRDYLEYVETTYQQSRKEFLQKQSNLASFQDANRKLVTAIASGTEKRLSSEYDIALSIYNDLAKQREQAKLALKESTPVFSIIEPVVVPQTKSSPNEKRIIILYGLLGLILSCVWVIALPFVKSIINEKTSTE